MRSLAVLHASHLVTLAGPKRPRVGCEMSELAIIHEGGMLIRDSKLVLCAVFLRRLIPYNERSAG